MIGVEGDGGLTPEVTLGPPEVGDRQQDWALQWARDGEQPCADGCEPAEPGWVGGGLLLASSVKIAPVRHIRSLENLKKFWADRFLRRHNWTWKSRRRRGRPKVDREIRILIRQMANENVGWGAPRIHGEWLKLGFEVSQATVSRHMPRRRKPPSQTWCRFLLNHTDSLVSIDFFVVPTATFRTLYVFLVLEHRRRRVLHFNVAEEPSARWTGQQIVNAFPYDSAPKYLIRDRDKIYGADFVRRIRAMGFEQVLTAPRSPWQNPYCERVFGSIRRECVDHVIVLGEHHLRRILREYLEYYYESRTQLSLDKDAPEPRERATIDDGNVVAFRKVGGLHHHYTRQAA